MVKRRMGKKQGRPRNDEELREVYLLQYGLMEKCIRR
jgi:hypothetical protein